ncbi:MCT family MFS transporter [Aspergillus ruber CBS 135680]|uniref:Putative MFS monocarboxylate transporter n=1 Tax=Aspergillus ruber (strain CBS 135680) TaxID=1388766 RepID=A0A017S5H9_ASPRC|nr:putative MFS monocarboxylate transporter [Aspergillus ruber CBS 135680]EYE91894.1 putative MFS monocarboxylate transporter [Aspergillus ruber CBS 135680]
MGAEDNSQIEAQPQPQSEYTLRANLTILGAFTGLFCTVGFLNSFGVFETYYMQYQLANETETTIAWIGALSVFFIFSISVISGPLLDFFGPGLMLYVGSVGTVFAMMMASLCKVLWQFILAQGILLGVSMALLVTPMLALVGQHIKVKRAAAMGIVIAGSSLGGVIWPIVIRELLQKPNIGFPWTMRISGFIMLPLLLISCTCCRPAPAPQPTNEDQTSSTSKEPKKLPKTDFSILKQPKMQLTCLSFFIIYFGMFSPFFFTTSYGVKMGFSDDLSFYTVSIVNGASFFGRILPGIVADKYGKFNSCIVATSFAGIIALCWTKATSVAGLVVWSAAYGFASGGILSLQQACAAQVATSQTLGLAIGAVMGSTSLSAMAGIPIGGQLAGKYGYLALSTYSGVSLLVGAVLLVIARLAQNRRLLAIV